VISIAGAAARRYTFPAPLDAAFRFHCDLDRMLGLLPHIAVVAAPSPATWRLRYHATEAALFRVRVYCTVEADVDRAGHCLRIRPLDDPAPLRAGFRWMSGHGRYASTVRFQADGGATRIDYALEISARVATAGALQRLPPALVDARAARRFHARLDEIVDGFVSRSIAAFVGEPSPPGSDSRPARASHGPRA
jgi:hypothetical protein